MVIRLTHAMNAAEKIAAALRKWNMADGPHVSWNGSVVKALSEEADKTIRQCCDKLADAGHEVDEKARPIVMAMDDVAAAFKKWMSDAVAQNPMAPPAGSPALHRALDFLAEATKSVKLPLPTPIKELNERRISPQQIAIIYGWKTEDGSADVQKVFEELEKPGTHYKPNEWVHPALKKISEEVNQRWAARTPRGPDFGFGPDSDDNSGPTPQIPSIDELFAARAPVAQIARLHRMDEQDVRELAASQGINLDERYVQPATPEAAHQEHIAEQEQLERDIAKVAAETAAAGSKSK